MGNERKKQYDLEYRKEQTRRFVLSVNRRRSRLIAHLEAQPNLTQYLVNLIEEDMRRNRIDTD